MKNKKTLVIVIACLALLVTGFVVRAVTKKEAVLYTAFVNFLPEEDTCRALSEGFIRTQKLDPRKNEVVFYKNLYLDTSDAQTENEYSHNSQLKLLATVSAGQLDVILMDRASCERLEQAGWFKSSGPIPVDDCPLLKGRFDQDIYYGVLKNTPRAKIAEAYIEYISFNSSP